MRLTHKMSIMILKLYTTLAVLATTVAAFTPQQASKSCSNNFSTRLHASAAENTSRRQVLRGILTGTFLTTATTLPANAEIDFERIQDLLGKPESDATSAAPSYSPNTGRPTWLVEPTEEFKANEQKASDFKRQQIRIKKSFSTQLDALQTVPDEEAALLQVLDTLRALVKENGGLPEGIVKEAVVKQVRRRKAKKPKYWPTEVEIAYQDLILEIQYQQSPNIAREGFL